MTAARLAARLDQGLSRVALWAGCLALAVALGGGVAQIGARFLLGVPAIWTEALVRTALIWMAFLGLAAAIRAGALVSIDLCWRLARGPWRRVVEAVQLATTVGLMAILAWHGAAMARRVAAQEMAGLEVSIAWGYAAIPFGCALAIIAAVARFLDRRDAELEHAT